MHAEQAVQDLEEEDVPDHRLKIERIEGFAGVEGAGNASPHKDDSLQSNGTPKKKNARRPPQQIRFQKESKKEIMKRWNSELTTCSRYILSWSKWSWTLDSMVRTLVRECIRSPVSLWISGWNNSRKVDIVTE